MCVAETILTASSNGYRRTATKYSVEVVEGGETVQYVWYLEAPYYYCVSGPRSFLAGISLLRYHEDTSDLYFANPFHSVVNSKANNLIGLDTKLHEPSRIGYCRNILFTKSTSETKY